MLIEFKVSNYRSIREQQTFSLVASNAVKELPDCIIEKELLGLSGVSFLRGAAIYGANASGKSNILEAIDFLSSFVLTSAVKLQPGDSTNTEPFKLDRDSTGKPSEFEITFVAQDVRYVYGVSLTTKKVVEEYLVAYPKGVPQRWYSRRFDEKIGEDVWSKPSIGFKHDKSLQDKTRENSLFLSVAPQFNHPQLTIVFNWFKSNLHFIRLNADSYFHPGFTAKQVTKPSHHDRIVNLLRSADIGVADALIEEQDVSLEDIKRNLPPAILADMEERGALKPAKSMKINLTHKGDGIEPVALDFEEEESAGTRRFFSLLGPWMDILDEGYTVFIDEIETSLHPLLVRELLKLLFCRTNNPKGAQVVFTTHNPILLDNALMRRDQIWFTEKSQAGATHLYPLTDYQPRDREPRMKGYLAGRYGAIPYLPEGLKL